MSGILSSNKKPEKSKVLVKQHWTEKLRQILFFLTYLAVFEYTYPTPFLQSRWGQVIYFIILFYILKGVIRYRQERSPPFYAKTQRIQAKWQARKLTLTDYTRYRIQRIVRFVAIMFTIGWMIDGAIDQCEGAIACAASIPSLITGNLSELIGFAIRLAMSMFSLFGIMWLLARMDLYTLILPDAIATRFSDVYGQDDAVAKVREALAILDKPDEVEAAGGFMPSGILLSGPPGVGKSYLAEAAAGEVGKPFVYIDGSSFTSMWMGVPLMKVKMIFKHLRKFSVKYGGVVVFFDEIDSLGSRGGGVLNDLIYKLMNKVTNQVVVTGGGQGGGALQMMLTEMSGISKPRGLYNKIRVMAGFKPVPPPKYRILWLAATNLPEALDPAMLRPGRFDRKIYMGYPQILGRFATFKGYLNKVKHDLTDEQITVLARENPRATGASIKTNVNEGLLKAIREGRDTITFTDMREVILSQSMGETQGKMELPEDRWRTAVHEAAHAVASHHFRPEAPIQFASVMKRGKTGGFVRSVNEVDRYPVRSRMIADIKVNLASVWAEKHFFNDDISTGPSSDLKHATTIATAMWTQYAMGNTVFVTDKLEGDALSDLQDWMHEIYNELHEFMTAHRDEVELVAQLLDRYETVDGEEIHSLLGRFK